MTEEFEAWAALIERVGFSAAIIGMIAYAIRSVSKWGAPLVQDVVASHVKFVEGTHSAVSSIKETVAQQANNGARVADTLEALNKAVSVKLDKRGEEYGDHVFSSTRLEAAADPALEALARMADGPQSADDVRALVAKAKDALRG